MSNVECRMSKDGIARAAQALAPRVAQAFLKNRQNTFLRHSLFDIRYSLFQSFFYEQTGPAAAGPEAALPPET